jgi:aminoglycoside phosphotransferase (APT) family kinase protein
MPTPRCYYCDANELGNAVLLLQDLAPARSGDITTRDNLAQAECAIRELARFHAVWWADPRLDEMDWLMRLNGGQAEQIMKPRWEPFLERAGDKIPDKKVIECLQRNGAYVTDWIYSQSPLTLLHNDYQADNLFFATSEGGVPFAVIDWQMLAPGRGAYDVSFYLCRGAPPQERRAIEMGMLEIYHSTLVENGVQGYTFEQCLNDYRLSALYTIARLGYPISYSLSPEHKQLYLDVWLPQTYAAVIDLDAVALLPK